jgi:hypothetical protein
VWLQSTLRRPKLLGSKCVLRAGNARMCHFEQTGHQDFQNLALSKECISTQLSRLLWAARVYTCRMEAPNRARATDQPSGELAVRRPLRIQFEPPADLGIWRLTGRINWPSPNQGYGVPIGEWTNDKGTRIWLSAQLKELAVEFVDGAEDCRRELAMRSRTLLQQFNAPLVSITLCYLHLAADVVA